MKNVINQSKLNIIQYSDDVLSVVMIDPYLHDVVINLCFDIHDKGQNVYDQISQLSINHDCKKMNYLQVMYWIVKNYNLKTIILKNLTKSSILILGCTNGYFCL